jgi:serine/threonine protein kinase
MKAYPCTFEEVSEDSLLESLPAFLRGKASCARCHWYKVRSLAENPRTNIKVFVAKATQRGLREFKGLPESFVVKLIPRDTALDRRLGLENGLNELYTAMGLVGAQIPFVSQVYLVGRDDKNFFIVSEHARDELFATVQQSGGFRDEEVLRSIAWQLFKALSTLHLIGIAHRDLSLENVALLDREIRLIDFGQAIMVHAPSKAEEESLCRRPARGLPGKSNYRPPELYARDEYSAKKLDIFAAGVILFACVAGNYPGILEDIAAGKENVSDEDLPGRCFSIREELKELGAPAGLRDLLELLLAPSQEKRPSAGEVLRHHWVACTLAPKPARAPPALGETCRRDVFEAKDMDRASNGF